MAPDRSTAENYHEATKYSEEMLTHEARQPDWSARPSQFKEFVTERRIRLAAHLPFRPTPFGDTDEEPGSGDLARLSRLLYFSNGITAFVAHPIRPDEVHALRAAPSAGALYPTEMYIACRGCEELPDGIYNYQAVDHSVVPAWEGNFFDEIKRYCFDHPAIPASNFVLLLTGVWGRTAWRYGERAYRQILLDTGHVLGNVNSYCTEEGFAARPIAAFNDGALNHLMFLNDEEEALLMVVALPRAQGTEEGEGAAAGLALQMVVRPGTGAREAEPATMVTLHKSGYYDETNTAAAGEPISIDRLDAWYTDVTKVVLQRPNVVWRGIAQTILRRRSSRIYTGEAISPQQLSLLLWHAYAPMRGAPAFASGGRLCDPSMILTYVVVNHVTDMFAGAYYYAPAAHELRTARLGDFASEFWHVCLGQELGRDASIAVIHVADLPAAVARYGNRGYRYLHLDAGHLGEYLNLAAVGLGLGASGIGGFFDDEVNRLLGLPERQIVVYITTIGQPS